MSASHRPPAARTRLCGPSGLAGPDSKVIAVILILLPSGPSGISEYRVCEGRGDALSEWRSRVRGRTTYTYYPARLAAFIDMSERYT